jgi:hypothetical protein
MEKVNLSVDRNLDSFINKALLKFWDKILRSGTPTAVSVNDPYTL